MTADTPDTPPHDTGRFSPDMGFLLIALALVLVGAAATMIWGLPGLAMTALAMVPVVYALLILISVGK